VKDGTLPLLTGLEHATLSPDKTIRNPVECRAVRYIIDNKLASISSNTILNICRDNKEEQTFLSKYVNQPSADIIASLLTRSSTWNVYSLNEMILSLLNNPIKPDSFLYKWKQLLEQGVATDNRENADYFLKQTKELMYAADITDLITTTTASSAALL
jgi:hypothetical protein